MFEEIATLLVWYERVVKMQDSKVQIMIELIQTFFIFYQIFQSVFTITTNLF